MLNKYTSILVGSLPSVYNSTLSSILAAFKLSKTPLNPDTVISLITDNFDQCKLSKKGKGKDDRDVAYQVGIEERGGKGGRKDKECHNCKKHGHFKADCWAKGGGKEGQGLKGKDKGNEKGQGVLANMAATRNEEDKRVQAVVDENGQMCYLSGFPLFFYIYFAFFPLYLCRYLICLLSLIIF